MEKIVMTGSGDQMMIRTDTGQEQVRRSQLENQTKDHLLALQDKVVKANLLTEWYHKWQFDRAAKKAKATLGRMEVLYNGGK